MAITNALKKHLSHYGPWAVVTGASSGIGNELAKRLAEAGINLVLVGRSQSSLQAVSLEVEAQYGVETQIIEADLADREGVDIVIRRTADLEVGLLVASAGFGTSGEFLQSSLEEELNMLRVNCAALFMLTHHFAEVFATRERDFRRSSQRSFQQSLQRKGIILLSSIVGFQGVPYAAHYAATKAYVQSLGEALAVELKPVGVDVLTAAPGPVNSRFGERANMQMGKALHPSDIGVPILKALGRQSTVLPGFLTKFLVGSLRTVPRWGKVRIMRLVMGGMTKHQRQSA